MLEPGDLVDDRELEELGDDQFRHGDIIEQLDALTTTIRAPANIALYGRWGSGKSSIGALLEHRLTMTAKQDVRFVRYDAFKFARLPLQRHFISQIATQLKLSDREFHAGLYEDVGTNDITLGELSDRRLRRLIVMLLVILTVLVLAIAAAALVTAPIAFFASHISHDKDATFASTYLSFLKTHTIGFLAPAGLLSFVAVFAGRKLTVSRGSSAPTSEEQFHATFKRLVDKALSTPEGKLVVFIDELDRCDAETVVATLESLRTFLDAERCVFIVAADQIVLEDALTAKSKQASPVDPQNPYYSSGTEYLDKTFHYQFSIPPLLPTRLTKFAADLVRGRGGLWDSLASIERVVSVLIPNHVSSPRRVKTLLNSFALLYRLAEDRARAGHLPSTVNARAEEIAVLAALRAEFPLFARELQRYPQLPSFVRRAAKEESPTESDPSDVWRLAVAFRDGKRPTDLFISADGSNTDTKEISPDVLRVGQAQQLISYLFKTAFVPGPGADLVFMESKGSRLGLDLAIADLLENAASQGDLANVRRLLEQLGPDRRKGLTSLADSLDRDAPPLGHEAQNLATTLLQLYPQEDHAMLTASGPDEPPLTSRIADAINAHARTYSLRKVDLAGAFTLGADAPTSEGRDLSRLAMEHEGASSEPTLLTALVAHAGYALSIDAERTGSLVASGLFTPETHAEIMTDLGKIDTNAQRALLDATGPYVGIRAEEFEGAVEVPDGTSDDDARDIRAKALTAALTDVFDGAPSVDVLARLIGGALTSESRGARDAVAPHLPRLTPDDTRDVDGLSTQLLRAATRRAAQAMAPWLAAIDARAVPDSDRSSLGISLFLTFWKYVQSAPGSLDELLPDGMYGLMEELARFTPVPISDSATLTEVATSFIAPRTQASAIQARIALERIRVVVTHGILYGPIVAEGLVDPLAETLRATLGLEASDLAAIEATVGEAARWAAAHLEDRLDELISAALASPWLRTPAREGLAIALASHQARSDPPISSADVRQLAEQYPAEAAVATASWIRRFAQSPSEAYEIFVPILNAGIRVEGEAAHQLNWYARGLSSADILFELAVGEIRRCPDAEPRFDYLRAVEFTRADAHKVADQIIQQFAHATNMERRACCLGLWEAHSPTADDVRAKLIKGVLVPTAEAGSTGVELALTKVALWRNAPRGTKLLIREALRKYAHNRELKKRVETTLEGAGLVTRRRTWTGSKAEDVKD